MVEAPGGWNLTVRGRIALEGPWVKVAVACCEPVHDEKKAQIRHQQCR